MAQPSATKTTSERVAEAMRPIPRFELIFPSRSARLRYELGCRAPAVLKIAWAELLGRLDPWRRPERLAEARAINEPIIAGTSLARDRERLARRRLVEERVRELIFWRRHWGRDPVLGAEHMHAALAQGRGVILSFCHMGSFHGTFSPLWRDARRHTYIATNSWFFDPPDGSPWTFRLEHWRRAVARCEGRIVRMPAAFDTLRALLEQREVVMIAFDMPGSMTMRFLGKDVALGSGTVGVAFETDSIVLPVRRRRRGARLHVEFGPPLDPRDHSDPEELQKALAARHERWILERPAALENPARQGAWENEAQPGGWARPSRERTGASSA